MPVMPSWGLYFLSSTSRVGTIVSLLPSLSVTEKSVISYSEFVILKKLNNSIIFTMIAISLTGSHIILSICLLILITVILITSQEWSQYCDW